MTGEEMERAIEFVLDSQARSEARIEETNRQIADTNRRLESFADTQAALLGVVTRTFAAQNEINEDVRRGQEALRHGNDETRRGHEQLLRSQENLQRGQEQLFRSQENLQRGHEQLFSDHEKLQHRHEQLLRGQENLQRSQEAAWVVMHRTEEAIGRTEETLDRLAEIVRLHVEGGHGHSRG